MYYLSIFALKIKSFCIFEEPINIFLKIGALKIKTKIYERIFQ
jgi:hypothetical protein